MSSKILFTSKMISRKRRGAALILALILMALGGLIVVPLLNYVGGGFKNTSQVYSSNTRELYCSDAGVREAMWNIMHDASWLPDVGNTTSSQNIGIFNGKQGTYTITRLADTVYEAVAYRINSYGTDPVNSHATSVTADVTVADFSTFMNNALTSPSSITTKKNDQISGNIQSPVVDGKSDGTLNAKLSAHTPPWTVNNNPVIGWPTVTATNDPVARFYSGEITNAPVLSGTVLDITVPALDGPLYAGGSPNYTLQGSGSLAGTVYIDGNLSTPNGVSLDLNNQTLFVSGSITVMPNASISGPGAIIALGNIDFQPNHTNSKFIYLMSIQGTINFQPNSNFVGAIAGNSTINLQPNNSVNWINPPDNLNLPGGLIKGIGSIENWKVH